MFWVLGGEKIWGDWERGNEELGGGDWKGGGSVVSKSHSDE